MIFKFDGDPVAKPRQTQSDKWKKRPPVTKYRGFADLLRLQLNVQGWGKLKEKPRELKLTFYLAPPQKRLKEILAAGNNLIYHDQKPDIDNLAKSVLDVLYEEDKTIHTIIATKYFRIKPGIDIEFIDTQ